MTGFAMTWWVVQDERSESCWMMGRAVQDDGMESCWMMGRAVQDERSESCWMNEFG
ncbi:MAG: hypothetical protein LKK12_09660 [Bacteroidales bacterium]|jgi:hypothetical protein|nr:hypothetical protein [Bacteroidales bacterium]